MRKRRAHARRIARIASASHLHAACVATQHAVRSSPECIEESRVPVRVRVRVACMCVRDECVRDVRCQVNAVNALCGISA